ncbi:MAG: hypothetical protein LBU65_00715 [Planctomycetaceae bacterium]|nr:hypothetical protein [Planctomycetaceae bacterium]
MNQKIFYSLAILFVCFLGSLPGCGNGGKIKTEQVSGKVTYEGKAVEGATVIFSPVDRTKGNPASGITDAAGKYVLQTLLGDVGAGTTPGEYKVSISKNENVETGRTQKETDGTIIKEYRAENRLPAKYAQTTTSPLSATVKEGTNTFDFILE